jgi:hypothetical protein
MHPADNEMASSTAAVAPIGKCYEPARRESGPHRRANIQTSQTTSVPPSVAMAAKPSTAGMIKMISLPISEYRLD